MLTNPYRAYPEPAASTPGHGCIVCRTRAALAHVNWLHIAAWVVVGALTMVTVASATLAYASVTMDARMVAAVEVLGAAAARKDRAPNTPPIPHDPPSPNPSGAVSVCTSVEREVSRDVLLAALNEERPFSPRIVPEVSNGRLLGLRLFGVREGSGLSRLGLVNGDVVLSINGSALGSPEEALAIYERAQTAEELVVELSRKGTPRELRFHVRSGRPSDPERQRLDQNSLRRSKSVAF